MVIFLFILIAILFIGISLVIYTIAIIAIISEATRDLVGKNEIEHNRIRFQTLPSEDSENKLEQNSNLLIKEDSYLDSP
ncbi:MAG: hypothetical protein BRC33_02990 [Cyanobacteria bacterium SW_9_44_58]|nr:MAG: hypothetical protein BRC33_02990 [Cyanobacteria bacterium SW_9_44_58]